MSQDDIDLIVGQKVAERARLRKELSCTEAKISDLASRARDIVSSLSPDASDQQAEDLVVRRIRELPQPDAVAKLLADRRTLRKGLAEIESWLSVHGLDLR